MVSNFAQGAASISGQGDGSAPPLQSQKSMVQVKPHGNNGGANNIAPLYFGGVDVSFRVFLRRRYVFAMVNDRPQVDGHVLICPVR